MELIYGPVKSLRYGNTLGINLLGSQKVCSYNCVYCDLGPTVLTMNKVRKDLDFPSLPALQAAFKEYIKQNVPTEAIVVSGNGEPTLYPDFEEAMKTIVELRNEHLPDRKIVVLTNGAHLDNKKVLAGLNLADERVIKIDAGNDQFLQKVNDPLIRINIAKFLNGVQRLKSCTVQSMFFTGSLDNTVNEHLEEWIEIMGMIKPSKIQLCTLARPAPNMPGLKPLDEDALYSIAFRLKKRTNLEATVFAVAPA